jgi:hypothetical protein
MRDGQCGIAGSQARCSRDWNRSRPAPARRARLAFTAASAEEFVDTELRVHPGWIAARALLEPRDEMQAVRDRVLEIFEAANEDAAGFQITSRYVVTTARRG